MTLLRLLCLILVALVLLTAATLAFDNPESDCDTDTACRCDLNCLE